MMGLYCSLHRATDDQIRQVVRNPEELASVLEAIELVEEEAGELVEAGAGPIRALGHGGMRTTPPYRCGQLDLEKDWHALHYLLTGSADGGAEPFSYLLSGGTAIGDGDDGWTAQALTSQQVKRFARSLSGISASDLLSRYDADRMTALNIYPCIVWKRDPQRDLQESLAESFEALKPFVQESSERNMGLIVYIG